MTTMTDRDPLVSTPTVQRRARHLVMRRSGAGTKRFGSREDSGGPAWPGFARLETEWLLARWSLVGWGTRPGR